MLAKFSTRVATPFFSIISFRRCTMLPVRSLKRPLQFRALFPEVFQHGLYRGQRQRMTHERPREEGDAYFGVRTVAELPHAPVKRVHVLALPCQHANGHAAREHFSVRRQIGANIEKRLAAARVYAKSGYNFIEDQASAGILGDLPQLLQELHRLKVRVAALHRFHHHGGERRCVGSNPFERFGRSVFQNGDICNRLARNSRRGRNGLRNSGPMDSLHQNFIEHSMVVAREKHDLVPAGYRPSHAHRRDHGFGSRVAERRPLVPGEFADHFRHFAREQRLRPGFKSLLKLLRDRLLQKVGTVAEHDRPKTVQDVDVFVPVHVP